MQQKFKRTVAPKLRSVLLLFVAMLLVAGLAIGIRTVRSFTKNTGLTPAAVFGLMFDTGVDLAPIKGRVNVALLGIGGGNHDGADLTDTILILSFNEKHDTLGMISVPRDIWSDSLKDKVNSAYHYGEEKSREAGSAAGRKKGGLILSKAILSDMVGLPIQYGIVFDFTKFQNIIDLVSGVTIDVPEAFTDSQYPITGKEKDICDGDPTFACRYETLHFDKGLQTMDGERALKYVRSRHAEGVEGNDFARGRRQQQVLVALKDRLTSKNTIWNPRKLSALYRAFDDATDVDMNIAQLMTVGKLFLRVPQINITRISIENELYSPPESWYGGYVLLPKDTFESIHEYVSSFLK